MKKAKLHSIHPLPAGMTINTLTPDGKQISAPLVGLIYYTDDARPGWVGVRPATLADMENGVDLTAPCKYTASKFQIQGTTTHAATPRNIYRNHVPPKTEENANR